MPFEIPDNWTWIRVSSICKTIGGYAFKSSQFTNTGIRVIRISDFDETGIKNKDIKRYKFTDKLKDYQIMLNDILMCMTGGTVGKAVLITQIEEPIYINQRVALFRSNFINNEYLYCVLVSLYVREIIKSSKTSTNDNISMDLLNNILLPLPPENEQSRIIRAISNYEPLLNKYADLEFKLSKLESSFEEKLKASILQYAIEGKLVKQDPADEPASVLLERIKAEKEILIKEGKIKRDKKESFIYQSDDKNYYGSIPKNWAYSKLGNICLIINGFTPSRSNASFWNNEISWLTVEDINNQGKYIYKTEQAISKSVVGKGRIIPANNVILCCTSASIGKLCINKINTTTNQQFNGLVKICNLIETEYLFIFCSTLKSTLLKIAGVTTFPFVSVDKLKSIVIPIPPLNEQKNISNKVRKLFDAL